MLTISSDKKWLIIITCLILLVSLFQITDPIPQDLNYHLLADTRQWLNIPNFANVISNTPFAVIGLLGLFFYAEINSEATLSWSIFFIGLIFVAIGSGYYHLNPNNQSLVWDRLPMTISFMGLFVALLIENVPGLSEKLILPVAILLGLSSVIYWHYTDDLRFYGIMQFAPLAAIPVILYRFNGCYSHRQYLIYGLLFYILAKVFEFADKFIFEHSGELLSGHTIKHLLAAAATFYIYLMLKERHSTNPEP